MSARKELAPGLTLHLRHVRAIDPAAGPLCTHGIRAWCRQHRIDLHALATTGIDSASRPDLHDDPFVARVLQAALREREAAGES